MVITGANVLVFSVGKPGFDHAFLRYFAHYWARVRATSDNDVSKEEIGQASFEVQEEGEVEGHNEVDGPCWQVLDHALLLCDGFGNGFGSRGSKLGTIVVAESY